MINLPFTKRSMEPSVVVADTDTLNNFIKAAGVFLGAGGAGTYLLRRVLESRKNKKDTTLSEAFRDIHEVYAAMQNVLNSDSGLNRTLFVRVQNGGGVPSPTNHVTSSIVFEADVHGGTSIRDSWQNVPVDADQAQLIHDLFAKDIVHFTREQQRPGASIRAIYETEKVQGALVSCVCRADNYLCYLACHYPEGFTSTQVDMARAYFRRCVDTVRGILGKYGKSDGKTHSTDLDMLTGGTL